MRIENSTKTNFSNPTKNFDMYIYFCSVINKKRNFMSSLFNQGKLADSTRVGFCWLQCELWCAVVKEAKWLTYALFRMSQRHRHFTQHPLLVFLFFANICYALELKCIIFFTVIPHVHVRWIRCGTGKTRYWDRTCVILIGRKITSCNKYHFGLTLLDIG
jgi:hypothetical protein